MHGLCRCVLDENHSGTFHVCNCEHHWRDAESMTEEQVDQHFRDHYGEL